MTYSVNRFDALRAQQPDLVLNLYAMAPGGPVTLEIITPDNDVYIFTEPTAELAMEAAFPITTEPVVIEPPGAEPSIFD